MRAAFEKTVLVVDEGSLASTVQARDLLRIAERLRVPRFTLPSGTPVSIFGTSGITSTGNTAGRIVVVNINGSAGIVGGDTGFEPDQARRLLRHEAFQPTPGELLLDHHLPVPVHAADVKRRLAEIDTDSSNLRHGSLRFRFPMEASILAL